MRILLGFALVGLLAGCATAKAAPTLTEAAYGPLPSQYREMIMAHFRERLFDPESGRYRFSAPVRGYLRKAPVAGGDMSVAGWVVGVGVNAKNRFGGYVGERLYRFLVREDQLIEFGSNMYFSEPWYAERWPYPYQ